MSLCLEAGHRDAYHYPLGRLFDEANIIIERHNSLIVTETQLRVQGVGTLFSKGMRQGYEKLLKQLDITTEPIRERFRRR